MSDKELRSVESMYVSCSLRVRNFEAPGVAMSDCCQKPATTAVTMPTGVNMWRCEEHKGVRFVHPQTLEPQHLGPVVTHVVMNKREV